MDTPGTIKAPDKPRLGVSRIWRGLAILALAGALVLALLASKYSAALRSEQIGDSAARAALGDRITSLEHDVTDAHGELIGLRRQSKDRAEIDRVILAPDARIIHLAPLSPAPSASAVLVESVSNGTAALIVTKLSPAPSGQTYDLWWIGSRGEVFKATAVRPDLQGAAVAIATVPPASVHVVACEITLQPEQGAGQPGGTIYFKGAITER